MSKIKYSFKSFLALTCLLPRMAFADIEEENATKRFWIFQGMAQPLGTQIITSHFSRVLGKTFFSPSDYYIEFLSQINRRFSYTKRQNESAFGSSSWSRKKTNACNIRVEMANEAYTYFKPLPNVSPSAALLEAFQQGGRLDSVKALDFVEMLISLDFLGPEVFDKELDGVVTVPLKQKNLEFFYTPAPEFCPGDRIYLVNHEHHLVVHPDGEFPGENVVYVGLNNEGEKLLMGFGPAFTDGPLTEKQILDLFYEAAIKPPTFYDDDDRGRHLIKLYVVENFRASRKEWELYQQKNQKRNKPMKSHYSHYPRISS